MAFKPIPPAQHDEIVRIIDLAHSRKEREVTVYRDKKHNFLVTSLYQYGQGRTTITPAGESKYIGAGPVEDVNGPVRKVRWTKVEFEYVPVADRMLVAACRALNGIPNAPLPGWWVDTHRLASCIDAYLTEQYGKTAANFAGAA
jgi:hypothetical protein